MDEWRDAKTDPPKKADFYLATIQGTQGNRYTWCLFYRPLKKKWIFPDLDDFTYENVLYWMPYPPPKED